MQDTELNTQYKVAFSTKVGGPELPARLLGLNLGLASFAVPFACESLRPNETVPIVVIGGYGAEVYAGSAVVQQVIHHATGSICEVALIEAHWRQPVSAQADAVKPLRAEFDRVLAGFSSESRLVAGFAAVVADFQRFLTRLRDWLGVVEARWEALPEPERQRHEVSALATLSQPIADALDSIVHRFEALATQVPKEAVAAHKAHLREHLHPLLLSSPFAWRVFIKPLGYAGDYGMVEMMLRSPTQGNTLYAKLVNCWLVGQAPAEAHRHRVEYLRQILREESARVMGAGRQLRVLNLGCGPADEVQQFLEHDPMSAGVEMTLLDFNDDTLSYLQERLNRIRQATGRGGSVRLARRSVRQLLKESSRAGQTGTEAVYDYVYCAGLFDYLPDKVCRRLLELFLGWVTPGGLVVATNVSATMNDRRPFCHSMDYMLGWHLIYRDGAGLASLAPKVAPGTMRVIEEDLGVNLYLEIRKSAHD